MKFQVELTREARKDFDKLPSGQQLLLKSGYRIITDKDIEYGLTRTIDSGIFEVKTKDLRSLFKYEANQIMVIGVIYVKDSQKAPKDIIKRAKKILK